MSWQLRRLRADTPPHPSGSLPPGWRWPQPSAAWALVENRSTTQCQHALIDADSARRAESARIGDRSADGANARRGAYHSPRRQPAAQTWPDPSKHQKSWSGASRLTRPQEVAAPAAGGGLQSEGSASATRSTSSCREALDFLRPPNCFRPGAATKRILALRPSNPRYKTPRGLLPLHELDRGRACQHHLA